MAELKGRGRGRGLVASRKVFILLSLIQVWSHFPVLPTILHLLRRSAPFEILTCSWQKNWFLQGFHLVSFQMNEYFWKHPFAQIKKGELVLAELPAIVVQDGGDLAASESVPLFVFAKNLTFFLSLSPCSDSFLVFFMLLTWNWLSLCHTLSYFWFHKSYKYCFCLTPSLTPSFYLSIPQLEKKWKSNSHLCPVLSPPSSTSWQGSQGWKR